MAKINLLPWREELRKQQMQEFAVMLGMVVFAAIVAGFGWKMERERALETQKARNAYIETQISELEESIKEIEELQRRKNALVERMNVIQGLQGNRPTVVHVFDQFVETLPDGVYYTSIKQDGDKYNIIGIAESNNRVSNLMRSLDASPWFANPQLIKVMARGQVFEFSLSLDLEKPATEGASADGDAQANKKKT